MNRIALVAANGLGDALLTLVIAHNLQMHGYEVTTFSNYLPPLANWFPHKDLQALPTVEKMSEIFANYHQIISTDGAFLAKLSEFSDPRYHIFYEREFDKSKTVLGNFLQICHEHFNIMHPTDQNGLQVPSRWQARLHPRRVIIHPTSTSDSKNWPAKKFIRVARQLKRRDFEPVFIVSPAEFPTWRAILPNDFALPQFENLNEVAGFIYESGYMIGNDSGIGHLAANLGLPTLSLFARQRVANLWRPSWGNNRVVIATWQLPGARLRTKYWKNFLTVGKVLREFAKLYRSSDDQRNGSA